MIKIHFDLSNLSASLTQARANLGNLAPLHSTIGEYMVTATRDRFKTSAAPDGTRWRPKAPSTIAAYKSRGDGNRPKPLIGPSGRLRREIVSYSSSAAAEIGSPLEYSGVMQLGAAKGAFGTSSKGRSTPWGDIPARVFLGISDKDERNILDIVDEFLARSLGTR